MTTTHTIEEQMKNFADRCDDLLQAKFIVAPSKIGELLCAVAASTKFEAGSATRII